MALLAAGQVLSGSTATQVVEKSEPAQSVADPGGDVVAERVINDFPIEDAEALDHCARITTDDGPASSRAGPVPQYEATADGVTVAGSDPVPPRSRNPRRDKLAEERAVALTIKALEREVGSTARTARSTELVTTFEFVQGARTLHVEVKGIQGAGFTFNVTPKEFWRAETDPEWVVVAVTSVLSPDAFELTLITRDKVVSAQRAITGFRLSL